MLQARSGAGRNFPFAAGRRWNKKVKVPFSFFNSVFYDMAKL